MTFISFKRYREWLRSEGCDDKAFFAVLKEMITLTVIAAREAMRRRSQQSYCEDQSCYELIGLDFMVDSDIKPWIIECNLSPSLSTYADPSAGADDEVSRTNMLLAKCRFYECEIVQRLFFVCMRNFLVFSYHHFRGF